MKPTLEEIKQFETTFSSPTRRQHHARLVKATYYLVRMLSTGTNRFIELSVSCMILLFAGIPVLLFLLARKFCCHQPVYRSYQIYGFHAQPMIIHLFNLNWYPLKNLPLFACVLRGKVALTGISIKYFLREKRVLGDAYLFNNKPGIFNLWYIRKSSGIAHSGKFQTEWDYIFRHNLLFDLLLILKSLPALFYFTDHKTIVQKTSLFDILFNNLSMQEAISLLNQIITQRQKKKIYFINPDCLNKSCIDSEYREALLDSDYIFPDGIGISIACKLLKTPLKENINGTDMLPFLCKLALAENYKLFLLGGKPGVADQMRQKLIKTFPNLIIAGTHHGFFDKATESEAIINEINSVSPDIILVAFGAPYQEKWIHQYRSSIESPILMGVGGLFDFYSENIKRAPSWMREMGLEWIFRLIQEPGRMWKRYIIGNPVFLLRVIKWKMSKFNG